jgi:hypothetical protein
MDNLITGNVYTITTRAPAILGSRFERLTLKGVVDYDVAALYIKAAEIHKVVYPMLPVGTTLDSKALTYYIFKTEDNSKTIVLAREWIDMSTVVLVSTVTAKISVVLSSGTEVENIRKALVALGYSSFSIEVV